jgi:5-methylcytosine-specific restriction endonuclease McrA
MTEGKIISRQEAKALGLLRYFTGKPCKRGHIAERYTKRKVCFACQKEDHKRERVEFPEKRRERDRKSERKRIAANPEKEKARQKRWRDNNLDRVRATLRASRKRTNHYEKFREYYRHLAKISKARRKGAEGTHTRKQVIALLEMQCGRCVYCGKNIRKGFHEDHIIPLARGGTNYIENIQLTCPTCNLNKRAKDPIQFAQEIGRLL